MFEKLKRKFQPLINIYHLIKAIIASVYYGFPSRKLTIIGVSGTDGKTTTTHLLYHVLNNHMDKTSMISSIHANIAGRVIETGFHVTTPNSIEIQKYLRDSVNRKDKYFVLECTSHALNQNRLWGIRFDTSVITNITEEHLDYHKSYENYVNEKIKLLYNSNTPIINMDDQSFQSLSKKLKQKRKNFLTYSLNKKADFNFDVRKELGINVLRFNAYNYLAAYSVLKTLNIPETSIFKGFRSFKIPKGRMELIYDKEFKVIIDFAHTPNSFKNILEETITFKKAKKNRIIHVFGSAGLRDYFKRPLMGETSSKYSDIIILTEEDYRTEDPDKIVIDIVKGIRKNKFVYVKPSDLNMQSRKKYSIIINRASAIKKAISIANKDDIVIITGKSHERSIARGKKEYPWNETKAALKAINSRKNEKT
jgi:UDP-N-acetylmuramoyl-L-alanyl-D-glutamate--2,6-diaminopimelate ligase